MRTLLFVMETTSHHSHNQDFYRQQQIHMSNFDAICLMIESFGDSETIIGFHLAVRISVRRVFQKQTPINLPL